MKVAIVAGAIHRAKSGVYGSEAQAAVLARGFVKAGHDVTFLAAAGSDEVGKFRPVPCMYGSLFPNEETKQYEWYKDELVDQDFVVDWSGTHRVTENLYFWERDRFKGVLVWSHQGNVFTSPRPPAIGYFQGTVVSQAQKVHAYKHWANNTVPPHPSRIHVIPYGIETDVFVPPTTGATRDYFLYLSRPHPHKGIFEFLELASSFRNEKFVMAFDMAAPDHVEFGQRAIAQAKDMPNVEYIPLKGSVETKVGLYQHAKALVAPLAKDYVEGFGLVFAEAMACVPPGTRIVTAAGEKAIEQVRLGDRVLTHRGRFMPVTKLHRRRFSGRLYQVATPHNSLLLTGNHPLATNYGWVPASEVPIIARASLPRRAVGWGGLLSAGVPAAAGRGWLGRDSAGDFESGSLPGGTRGMDPLERGGANRCGPIENPWARAGVGAIGEGGGSGVHQFGHPVSPSEARGGYDSVWGVRTEALACRGVFQGVELAHRPGRSDSSPELGEPPCAPARVAGAFGTDTLRRIDSIEYDGDVLNLSVGDDHSYVADGLVVHNCGTPCITATHGGQVDVVGTLGALCETREEYVEAIASMAEGIPFDPAPLCRERIVRKFSVDRWVAAYLKLYTKIRRQQADSGVRDPGWMYE